MGKKKVLELVGKKGSLNYEKFDLDGKTFFTSNIIQIYLEENASETSPLYDSFIQAIEYAHIDIFLLKPEYIDPEIWNDLSEIYTNYCDAKELDVFWSDEWTAALGIHNMNDVYEDLEELGLSKDDSFKLCELMCKISIDDEKEAEIEECLNDPFAFEGGGPSFREMLLMLAKQVQG
jgi:hypothetical protein